MLHTRKIWILVGKITGKIRTIELTKDWSAIGFPTRKMAQKVLNGMGKYHALKIVGLEIPYWFR